MAKKSKENQIHPNLSNIDGTLTSAVQENAGELKRIFEDPSLDIDDIKDYLFELLESCKSTPWIKKATAKIEKMTDKNELAFFVYNSFLSGENLKSMR